MDTKSFIFMLIISAFTISFGGNIIYRAEMLSNEIDTNTNIATTQTNKKNHIFKKINLELDEEKKPFILDKETN